MTRIDNLLRRWGAQQRQLPPHADDLRARALAHAPQRTAYTAAPSRRWRFPRLAPALALLALIAFVAVPRARTPEDAPTAVVEQAVVGSATKPAMGMSERATANSIAGDRASSNTEAMEFDSPIERRPSPAAGSAPIADDRELLETSYSARARVRDVEGTMDRLTVTVRGLSGRVDRSVATRERGDLSFVIPQGKLDAFRQELGDLTYARLLVESVRTENRLPEQRMIEDTRASLNEEVVALNDREAARRTAWAQTRAWYDGEMQKTRDAVAETAARRAAATDAAERAALDTRIRDLNRQLGMLQQRRAAAAATFEREITAITTAIANTLRAVADRDEEERVLAGRVATITGTVVLTRLHYSAYARELLTAHWVGLSLALLAALALARWWRGLDREPLDTRAIS